MTSLRINTGTSTAPIWSEVDLPENWSMTLVSENVIMTKSSEYSLDCEINLLGNTKNIKIFGIVRRNDVTKKGRKFECILSVNNVTIIDHGVATITEITSNGIKLQLLGGNSEVNFRTNLDKLYIDKIELGNAMDDLNAFNRKYNLPTFNRTISGLRDWLNWDKNHNGGMVTKEETEKYEVNQTSLVPDTVMRTSDDFPFVMLPAIDDAKNKYINVWRTIVDVDNNQASCKKAQIAKTTKGMSESGFEVPELDVEKDIVYCPQPFLVEIIERVVAAIGYNVITNEIRTSPYKNVYVCNTTETVQYRQMLPHWTINKFFDEIENFFGCVIIFGKRNEVEIITRNNYYKKNNNIYLNKVIDEKWNVIPYEKDYADVSTATVKFKLQEDNLLEQFDETINGYAEKINNNNPLQYLDNVEEPLKHGTIVQKNDNTQWIGIDGREGSNLNITEANQFRKLDRGEESAEIELSICPAKYENTVLQLDKNNGSTPIRFIYPCPKSKSFAIESGMIDIENYIEGEEYETGEEDGLIVVALWEGIDNNPKTNNGSITNIPYYMGWSHGYNRTKFNLPEFRPIALRLVKVEGITTLGETFYGDTREKNFEALIDTTIKYEIEFCDNIQNVDLRFPFIFAGHRYVALNIERIIDKNGINPIKKGVFFRLN